MIVNLTRQEAYSHLKFLCDRDLNFGIRKPDQESDLEALTIVDARELDNNGRGHVIGTVRLLSAGAKTMIVFDDEDAAFHLQVTVEQTARFREFQAQVAQHFQQLGAVDFEKPMQRTEQPMTVAPLDKSAEEYVMPVKWEAKIKTNIVSFEGELRRFAQDYIDTRRGPGLVGIEISPWEKSFWDSGPIDRTGAPTNALEERRWTIVFTRASVEKPWQSWKESGADFAVSDMGDQSILLTISPCLDTALPFIKTFIGRCKQLWNFTLLKSETKQPMTAPTSSTAAYGDWRDFGFDKITTSGSAAAPPNGERVVAFPESVARSLIPPALLSTPEIAPLFSSAPQPAAIVPIDKGAKSIIDFVIITALEEERDAMLNKFPHAKREAPSREDVRIYYTADLPVTLANGETGSYSIVLLSLLGMGRLQAATATTDAIKRWQPRYVVMAGIAGGIAQKDVQLGDVLISQQIVDYELQKLTEAGPQIRWQVYQADPRLLGASQNLLETDWLPKIEIQRPGEGKPKRHIGPIASGDKVIAFGHALELYREHWSALIGVEMEAAGVATAAFQAAHPPLVFSWCVVFLILLMAKRASWK